MATNNIKPFGTSVDANLLTDEELSARSELQTGFPYKSKADSKLVGKLVQNATAGAYAVGEFSAKYGTQNVSGSDAAGFATAFENALESYINEKAPTPDLSKYAPLENPYFTGNNIYLNNYPVAYIADWFNPLTIDELDDSVTSGGTEHGPGILRIVEDSGYTQIFTADQYQKWHPLSPAFMTRNGSHTYVESHALSLMPGTSGKIGRSSTDTSETYAGIHIDPDHNDTAEVITQAYAKESGVYANVKLYANDGQDSTTSQANIAVGNKLNISTNGVFIFYNKTGDQPYLRSGVYFKDENINNGDYIALKDFALKSDISSVYKYKGSVASESALPSSDQTVGDVYNVEDTGDNYAWDGSQWDKLAGTVDLSSYLTVANASNTYLTKTDASSTYATKTEVTDGLGQKLAIQGSRGSLAGYESITVGSTAITINQDSPDSQQITSAVAITVSDGTANSSWVKKVSLKDAGATISLGSAWVWAGGSQPTVTAPSLLVLSWDNDCGIAVLQTTA